MVYQTDIDFIEDIKEFGCLFLSIAYYKTKTENYEWAYKELNSIYTQAQEQGSIDSNNEIINYDALIRMLNLPIKYQNKHSPIQDIDTAQFFGITKWYNENTKLYHFVVGTKKPVEYDPYSAEGSRTVREGYPVDMRLFSIIC